MTTWTTMRQLAARFVSPESCPWARRQKPAPPDADMLRLSKFVRASDLRILLLAFRGRQNALHMFHLAMFSEAILSMDAEVA
jgi:hypothetical protein